MGPIDALWHLLNFVLPGVALGMLSAGGAKLLWRRELATYFRSLSAAEAAALDAARSGWPFAELCELLCEEVGEAQAPAQAAELLRGWLAAGLIVGTS